MVNLEVVLRFSIMDERPPPRNPLPLRTSRCGSTGTSNGATPLDSHPVRDPWLWWPPRSTFPEGLRRTSSGRWGGNRWIPLLPPSAQPLATLESFCRGRGTRPHLGPRGCCVFRVPGSRRTPSPLQGCHGRCSEVVLRSRMWLSPWWMCPPCRDDHRDPVRAGDSSTTRGWIGPGWRQATETSPPSAFAHLRDPDSYRHPPLPGGRGER